MKKAPGGDLIAASRGFFYSLEKNVITFPDTLRMFKT
jgi:hypothetical protein